MVAQLYGDEIEKRRAERKLKAASINPDPLQLEDSETSAPVTKSKKQEHTTDTYVIKIAGPSEGLDWYDSKANAFHTLEAARKAHVWSYPSTLLQKAKCAVFKDLWDKGNYMGGGLKFGGDFLVYPGELLFLPMRSAYTYLRRSITVSLALLNNCAGFTISDYQSARSSGLWKISDRRQEGSFIVWV